MRLTIPITGTVLVEGSLKSGALIGDNLNPIRPVDIDLGNVSWQMIDVDIENEIMIIEVSPAEELDEATGEEDAKGNPIYQKRKATEQEKTEFLRHAQDLVMNHTKDELYQMSKCSRLRRPKK